MNLSKSSKIRLYGFFFLLVGFCCAPVWAVEFYINQDGSAHLYSSHIIAELLRGNPDFAAAFAFNSISVPNSSGHWLMALLLKLLSPYAVTKIMVTLTFAGFVAAVGWLRLQTAGAEGLKTAFLLGAAIAFNWLWLCGFYNFLIGVVCFVFTAGLIFRWRENLDFPRAAVLSFLFLLAYFSHIISFLILAGSAFLILVTAAEKQHPKRRLLYFVAALLPVLPFAVIYKSFSAGSGGGFFPAWRNLENPFSPVSWLTQLRTADPFVLISRKAFPFIDENSLYFAVFTPVLWITAALVLLAVATLRDHERKDFLSKNNLIFGFLFLSCVLAALFAPDDFGLTNGSVLRERLLICGLVFFVPLFRAGKSVRLKSFARLCFALVVIFQTAALWEYSLKADRGAREFLAAKNSIAPGEGTASVVLVEDGSRFNSAPLVQMNNYLGIERNSLVWDNYELGHYLFPIVARNAADRKFVFEFSQHIAFPLNGADPHFDARLSELRSLLLENRDKIKTLVVWEKEARIEALLSESFEPVFERGRVRVFRQK